MKKQIKLTRKQERKQKRKQIKIRRNEFFTRKKHIKSNDFPEENVEVQRSPTGSGAAKFQKKSNKLDDVKVKSKLENNKVLSTEQLRKKEQKEQARIQKDMEKQRVKQLLQANVDEDRLIRQLEKDLGLKKRKSKSLPKYFTDYGLDYLLEVCDPEARKNAIAAERGLQEVNDQFEEDFALMAEQNSNSVNSINSGNEGSDYEGHNENEEEDDIEYSEDNEEAEKYKSEKNEKISKRKLQTQETYKSKRFKQEVEIPDADCTDDSDENSVSDTEYSEADIDESDDVSNESDPEMKQAERFQEDSEAEMKEEETESDSEGLQIKGAVKRNPDGTWEDIYGRLRSKDGSIIQGKLEETRYVPPALRQTNDSAKMNKLRKQLKGLLNRLAESNMHSIASQIEELYMNNSRNDMNNALTNLILESIVSEVIVPERLLIEHVVLVAILHANVGTEVGAHFLQCVVKDFDRYLKAGNDVGNKLLDNVVNILAQLYNFKLFDCKLIYEVLEKLSQVFDEKCVECILHILRGVGFSLRKDDPLALKALILELQKQAAKTREDSEDNARVKFMLDILLAIKNNNVKKIPNYDTSYSEHLKKVMKGFIRKSNYVSQLNISLADLLKAEQKGKWWVVGSAWAGNSTEQEEEDNAGKPKESQGFSAKLLQLAKKQKMNTDTRKNIFCILMSAEDYMDAFEKILKLGLKNQQEREIINVILHCCLQEKKYNPYYGFVTQKLCDHDRRFQMTIRCSVWDKLKTLAEHSGHQLSNLAKLLTHLFIDDGLAISTLKIVQFSELDNVTLRFIRQILIGVLLHKEEEACLKVFTKVAKGEKLKMFRESLRLFIHHFLLRNLKAENISKSHREALQNRAKLVEKVLSAKEGRL